MSETAVVTGGLGRAGRWVVDAFAERGYETVCVDLDHPGWEISPRENVDFRAADLADAAEAFDLFADLDPDAVAHLAALPAPERHAGNRVFATNTESTYNVLTAAGRAGARIAWASSESAYGFPFAREKTLPDELPITEDHELRPEDPYGLSKVVGEETAARTARRYDVPVVSVRPSWVQHPGDYNCTGNRDDLAAGAGNFWSYVDARDLASLFVAAVEPDAVTGHEAVNGVAAENYVGRPTADVVEEFFGELPADCALEGEQSALSPAKARRLLDWEPEHTWRGAAHADVETPSLYE